MQLPAKRTFQVEKKIWCKGPNMEVPAVLTTVRRGQGGESRVSEGSELEDRRVGRSGKE